MSKLILGTAQFCSPYGIKDDPVPSLKEIEKIAQVAWDGGIRIIHTSWQYPFENIDVFDNFGRIHKDKDNPIYFKWKDRLGCSIYNESEIPAHPKLEIVQLPINVLDGRNLELAKRLKKTNFEIHARSVFLQGLLLMDIGILPKWIPDETIAELLRFQAISLGNNLEPYEAALGWVLGLDEIDKVIIGVNSAKQLEQLLAVKPLKWDYDFSIHDETVLDPRRWSKE